jgi:hypothetical protein
MYVAEVRSERHEFGLTVQYFKREGVVAKAMYYSTGGRK